MYSSFLGFESPHSVEGLQKYYWGENTVTETLHVLKPLKIGDLWMQDIYQHIILGLLDKYVVSLAIWLIHLPAAEEYFAKLLFMLDLSLLVAIQRVQQAKCYITVQFSCLYTKK